MDVWFNMENKSNDLIEKLSQRNIAEEGFASLLSSGTPQWLVPFLFSNYKPVNFFATHNCTANRRHSRTLAVAAKLNYLLLTSLLDPY